MAFLNAESEKERRYRAASFPLAITGSERGSCSECRQRKRKCCRQRPCLNCISRSLTCIAADDDETVVQVKVARPSNPVASARWLRIDQIAEAAREWLAAAEDRKRSDRDTASLCAAQRITVYPQMAESFGAGGSRATRLPNDRPCQTRQDRRDGQHGYLAFMRGPAPAPESCERTHAPSWPEHLCRALTGAPGHGALAATLDYS